MKFTLNVYKEAVKALKAVNSFFTGVDGLLDHNASSQSNQTVIIS